MSLCEQCVREAQCAGIGVVNAAGCHWEPSRFEPREVKKCEHKTVVKAQRRWCVDCGEVFEVNDGEGLKGKARQYLERRTLSVVGGQDVHEVLGEVLAAWEQCENEAKAHAQELNEAITTRDKLLNDLSDEYNSLSAERDQLLGAVQQEGVRPLTQEERKELFARWAGQQPADEKGRVICKDRDADRAVDAVLNRNHASPTGVEERAERVAHGTGMGLIVRDLLTTLKRVREERNLFEWDVQNRIEECEKLEAERDSWRNRYRGKPVHPVLTDPPELLQEVRAERDRLKRDLFFLRQCNDEQKRVLKQQHERLKEQP